ncbi:MAG: hypothetical protein Tsb002_30420 [Wenzhouxiangellaceae bacterium]
MNKKWVLLALLACMGVSQAQAQSAVELRESQPLLPAAGVWWTPQAGDGRWGLQIEVQDGLAFADGFFTAAVFSYESDSTATQAWYITSQEYVFNPDWRQDGYIAQLDLTLARTTEGTCLLCEDGEQPGEAVAADVSSAQITFFDSINAELVVDDVVHELVKAQWGDGVGKGLTDYWQRPFQVQLDLTTDVIPDSATQWRFIDMVTPVFIAAPPATMPVEQPFYTFNLNGVRDTITIAGPTTESVAFSFELRYDANTNTPVLSLINEELVASFDLFPLSHYLVEGRVREGSTLGGRPLSGQLLMISTPSMRDDQGNALAFPFAPLTPP